MRDLALSRFLDIETGALREYFDDEWQVYPAPGEGSVEPGHLFEWAWLLRRYEASTREEQTIFVEPLITMAVQRGLDLKRGRIIDEIGEDGQVRAASSRCWPHAEALKALTIEAVRKGSRHFDAIMAIYIRLCDVYCLAELNGGWVDHVDADDQPISHKIPASTLYHVYFAMTEVATLLKVS